LYRTALGKLLWFKITKMLIAVYEKNIVSFGIIFGTLSFPTWRQFIYTLTVQFYRYVEISLSLRLEYICVAVASVLQLRPKGLRTCWFVSVSYQQKLPNAYGASDVILFLI